MLATHSIILGQGMIGDGGYAYIETTEIGDDLRKEWTEEDCSFGDWVCEDGEGEEHQQC